MTKRSRIALFSLLLVLAGVFLFFYKIRDLDFGSRFETRSLMRNLTWQTDFRENVPYKKGDELEYTWIFSGDSPHRIGLDLSMFRNTLDITRIELDDREIDENDLRNIRVKDASLLKITGKAKNTSTNETIDLKPEITVETTEKEEVIEPPKAEENTGSDASGIILERTRYNSNINNLVTIRGKDLGSIEFVNIGEKRIRPVSSSGVLFVQIDRDTFASGEYFVFFTLRSGKIVTSDQRISFEHSDSPINIAGITPNTITNIQDTFVVIQGNGFDKIVSIQLSNNLILKNAEFRIVNAHVAGVKIPKDLPPGKYYFNIMDTASIYELKNMPFTITHP